MSPILFDALSGAGQGAVFGLESEDLDLTVVSWPTGRTIDAHVNREVDVVSIVLAGCGEVTVDGETLALEPGSVLMIPKGAKRAFRSLSDDFRYVNVHKRRRRLMPIS